MSQNEAKWVQACRKCSAGIGHGCRTNEGHLAEQVHRGRGNYAFIPNQRSYDRQPAMAGRYVDSAEQADYDERRYG